MTKHKAPQDIAALSFCAPAQRRGILIAAILASALGFIDGTVVSIALPAMRASLGATLAEATWFSNAYMLMLSALILAGGALGDRFGLARIFALGIGIFMLGSLACALATRPDIMIGARALKGVGAALMVPGSLALISRAYPRAERGRAIGIWAASSALTTALGPIIGGLVLSYGGPEFWRWIFAINLPFGLLTLAILARSVAHDPARPNVPVDLIGAGLATLSLGALAYGLTDLSVLWIGALGLGLFASFLLHEARATHPMVPLALFADRSFSAANLATLFIYAGMGAMLFFLPMTVITAWGITPLSAALAFAPLSVFISTLSACAGRLADRFGPARVIAGGASLVAASYGAVAFTVAQRDFWGATLPAMACAGLGMAFVVAPLSTAVMNAVDDQHVGTASGVNNAVSRMASLLAIAGFGSLAALAYGAAGGTLSFGETGGTEPHHAAVTAAFGVVAWGAAALAAAGALVIGLTGRR